MTGGRKAVGSSRGTAILGRAVADVAQLVERWLPKPKVAGSTPVVRLPAARCEGRGGAYENVGASIRATGRHVCPASGEQSSRRPPPPCGQIDEARWVGPVHGLKDADDACAACL